MLQRTRDGGGKPSGLDQFLRCAKHSPLEDSCGDDGTCSCTTLALDEHLEEKQMVDFQFEKEK